MAFSSSIKMPFVVWHNFLLKCFFISLPHFRKSDIATNPLFPIYFLKFCSFPITEDFLYVRQPLDCHYFSVLISVSKPNFISQKKKTNYSGYKKRFPELEPYTHLSASLIQSVINLYRRQFLNTMHWGK